MFPTLKARLQRLFGGKRRPQVLVLVATVRGPRTVAVPVSALR
jgi:hypothetical protein